MKKDQYKNYIFDLVTLLKEQAREAKTEADHPTEGNEGYNNGYLMAYHMMISLMKNQAIAFGIQEEEIGLDDIDPERDLL